MENMFIGKNVTAVALLLMAVFSFCFSEVGHAGIEDGLVAHYKFDGNANDSIGNWPTWTPTGNESYSDGVIGKSLYFDGETYWKIDDNFPNYQEFTISMWVNPSSMDDAVFYGPYCGPDGDAGVIFQVWQNVFYYSVGRASNCTDRSGKAKISSLSSLSGTWTHIVGVYKAGQEMTLYVNGHREATLTSNIVSNYLPLPQYLGTDTRTPGELYNLKGKFDELRIYNRALIDTEVQSLYTLAPSSSLAISFIPLDQQVNIPFSVTIQKSDASGNVDTSCDEEVSLFMEGASVSPTKVKLVNGTATFNVTAYTNGNGMRLQAHIGVEYYATSNQFDINGDSALGSVSGRVVDHFDQPLVGVTVHLKSFQNIEYFTTTVTGGEFQLTNLTPGQYYLWESYNDWKSPVPKMIFVSAGPNIGFKVTIPTSELVGKRPVILVPGTMGSDKKGRGNYAIPELPTEAPARQSELKIHDPGEWVDNNLLWLRGPGWEDLKEDIESAGFVVYPCPWDWRYHPGSNEAQDYLLTCIDLAKNQTGAAKVDIVAHSQGGLLTRAYIQNLGDTVVGVQTELENYRDDIDHFIMLGTPNHGSPLAYPMWAGGDPLTADHMAGSEHYDKLWTPADYFYSHTLNKVFKNATGDDAIDFPSIAFNWITVIGVTDLPPSYKVKPSVLRTFIRENIPATRSLIPENNYKFLCEDGACTSQNAVSDLETQNGWLTDLNNSLINLTNKGIKIKILGSHAINDTIHYNRVTTYGNEYDNVYEDGMPYRPWDDNILVELGDGTVSDSSLLLSGIDFDTLYKGDHAKLPGDFRAEITSILLNLPIQLASSMKVVPLSVPTTSNFFSVSLKGPYGLVVIGPDGKKNGVDLDTDTLYEESPDVTVYRSGDGMSVSLTNAPDGTYQFTITGSLANRVSVTLGFMDEDSQEEFDTAVYFDGSSASFAYKLSATSTPAFTLASNPAAPRYPVVKNQGGMTLLSWEAPEDVTPTSYAVYSRLDTEPFYTLLTTVSAAEPSYQTSHPVEDPKRFYAISAMNSEGDVGILSRVISNQIPDQYHLAVLPTGTGNGTISSSIDGIDCGFDCQEFYNVGQTITLTAVPDVGMSFLGWVGKGCSSTEEECTVTMDQARSISAVFSLKQKFPWAMFLPAITRGQ